MNLNTYMAANRCLLLLLAGLTVICGLPRELNASVCARVKIEIEQEVTLERQAFEARLVINNSEEVTMTNIDIDLRFFDAKGNELTVSSATGGYNVTDPAEPDPLKAGRFFFRFADGSGMPPGNSVTGPSSFPINWLIIPSKLAGGQDPYGTIFYVGAKITYNVGATQETVDIAEDAIVVVPQPDLVLDYFLPFHVHGDDPDTLSIEAREPFPLTVRVLNKGYGYASALKIESSQPKVVENDLGLLIDFRILSSSVDGAPALPTLLTDFGNLAPAEGKMGQWNMEVSLEGRFTEFDARFSHSDMLGGKLTSLIDEGNVRTNLLLGIVQNTLPGKDAKKDVLARVGFPNLGNQNMPPHGVAGQLKLFESQIVDSVAKIYESSVTEGTTGVLSGGGLERTLTTGISGNHTHIFVAVGVPTAYPYTSSMEVKRVVRSDGKVLPSAHAWLTRYKDSNSSWHTYVNLFDSGYLQGQTYKLTFASRALGNQPPNMDAIPELVAVAGQTVGVVLTATDPEGAMPVISVSPKASGMTLEAQPSPAPATAMSLLYWTVPAGASGRYTFSINATDGQLTRTDVLVVRVVGDSAYAEFKRQYGLGADTDDADGDGFSNLLEFAVGLNPTLGEDPNQPVMGVKVVDANGEQERYLTLSYVRWKQENEVEVKVYATDSAEVLGEEISVELAENQSNVHPLMERVVAVDTRPLGEDADQRFLHLKATKL